MNISKISECDIEENLSGEIEKILQSSFEGYPVGRTFFHQLPSFRVLGYEGKNLIGHLSVYHRVISSEGKFYEIFGIGDLCVKRDNQSTGVAGALIQFLENQARKSEVNFLMLVTDVNEFYLKKGFVEAGNICCWLMMQNNRSLGLVRRRLEGGFMYREVGKTSWPKSEIDLLGHIF
nr:GNAT family N-acetyltransferase [Saprospiraceae bacterium]